MMVLGIDPGTVGGFALSDDTGIALVDDLPVHNTQHRRGGVTRNELDLHSWKLILQRFAIDHAVVEDVHAMPKQGITSTFRFGHATGSITGLLIGLGIPLSYVTPQEWQKYHRCGATPDAARQRAVQLFPLTAERLTRKKDNHRADALLIAIYGRKLLTT
jgi:crossover junction endodeoxyribonuclease RuvC